MTSVAANTRSRSTLTGRVHPVLPRPLQSFQTMFAPWTGGKKTSQVFNYLSRLIELVINVLLRHDYFFILFLLIMLFEVVVGFVVIKYVPYTEIDWVPYMQEVKGFLDGERDYLNLRGDTGPLVYPAGFVYIYSGLYYLTDQGANIRLAQYIFFLLYLATQAVAMLIIHKSRLVPNYVLLLLAISKRMHSIFMLRLFNDTVAMFFLYVAVLLFIYNKWSSGCFFYSLAVSVKMNVLLFAPALLLLLLQRFGFQHTVLYKLSICAGLQVLLGLPFLLYAPKSYLLKAFELGREFTFEWTVNWKFLPEEVFAAKLFAVLLLGAHISLLLMFLNRREEKHGGIVGVFRSAYAMTATDRREEADRHSVRSLPTKHGAGCEHPACSHRHAAALSSISSSLSSSPSSSSSLLSCSRIARPEESSHLLSPRLCLAHSDHGNGFSAGWIVSSLFAANFIGIAFARTIHVQFYSWYFHSLPVLLWVHCRPVPVLVRLLLFVVIEYSYNVWPTTEQSSFLLTVVHLFVVGAILSTADHAVPMYSSADSKQH